MTMSRIFVCHAQEDVTTCQHIVTSLHDAGADIWHDAQIAAMNHWPADSEIQREIWARPVFIVLLSNAALASSLVRDQCLWAHDFFCQDRTRKLIAVPLEDLDPNEKADWPFLVRFHCIAPDAHTAYPLDEMIQHIQQALALVHPDGISTIASAGELIEQGKFLLDQQPAEAIPLFERAAEIEAYSSEPWHYLSMALAGAARYDEALLAIDCALGLVANDCALWTMKGDILLELGRYREALAAYDHSLVLMPAQAAVWRNKADILTRLEWHWDAAEAYQQALTLDPDNVALWQAQGNLLHYLWNNTKAVLAFDRALTLDPDNPTLWVAKADALRWLCQHQDALLAYDRAIALDPTQVDAWQGKAESLYWLRRYNEALAMCRQAIELLPGDAELWSLKGNILVRQDRFQEAVIAYGRAIALDPESTLHLNIPVEIRTMFGFDSPLPGIANGPA